MKNKQKPISPTLALATLGVACMLCTASPFAHAQATPPPAPQQPPGLILNGVPQPPGLILNGKPVATVSIPEVAATRIDLTVENGEWQDFLRAIGAATPKLLSVEMRGGMSFRASLKVTNMPIEDVLRGLAGFAHCNLYLLPGRFLVAPERLLRPAEKAQLIQIPPSRRPRTGKEKIPRITHFCTSETRSQQLLHG